MPDSSILSVVDLHKSYGAGASRSTVIDGLSFALRPGECYGLLGPNGAGKTTTLRLCLGLATPDSGSITLVGIPIPAQARTARMRVGVVPQGDNLDPDFTVSENLMVYGRYFRIPDRVIFARIPGLLEFSNLTAKKDARIGELSGGMKRRLDLASALVHEPEVLFSARAVVGDAVNGRMDGAGKALEPPERRQGHAGQVAVRTARTVKPVAGSQHVVHGSPGYIDRSGPAC